jgi:hypothetical protein
MFLEASTKLTYSLNLIEIFPSLSGKFTALESGSTETITGGIESLGPPVGGIDVFAQDWNNSK